MCDSPSPARNNSDTAQAPTGAPPHARFNTASPQGISTGASGPRLTGWPRQVRWNQFRERRNRPAGVAEDAQISVELRGGRVRVERENGQFRLGNTTFRMRFDRRRSWVVSGKKTERLLEHEQGHYDLAGLCYRDLVNQLRAVRTNSVAELQSEIRRIMEEQDQRSDELSVRYDEDTNHGLSADRQQVWDNSIRDAIRSGRPFSAPS